MLQGNLNRRELNYPVIDPEVAYEVDHLNREQIGKIKNHAFDQTLLTYGLDSVLLLHLMRELKAITGKNKKATDRFLRNYGIIFDDKESYGITTVSIHPFREAGIYIPEARTQNRLPLFNCDHLNRISCHSHNQIYDPDFLDICRMHWHRENFSDPELIKKAVTLAKEMWAINLLEYERFAVPEARRLINYYWSIVDSDGDDASDYKHKWILHQADFTRNDEESGLAPNGVFVGRIENLSSLLNSYERPQQYIEEIKAETRREIVKIICAKSIS